MGEQKAPDKLELSGRVAVVTGAAGAIGSEIARTFLAAGAKVALLDIDEDRVSHMARQIGGKPGQAIGIRCDVSNHADVIAAAERVKRELGPCDVLVNNAFAIRATALIDTSMEDWNRSLSVNLTGYFQVAQAFGKQMLESGGGSMIHIGSPAGRSHQPFSGAYSVVKAGIAMLSQGFAVELGEHGIRSNVVGPGMVRSPMNDSIYSNPDVLRRREEIVPLRRTSRPADVAGIVLFLASDRAAYITGQDIMADGGLTCSLMSMIPRPGFDKATATGALRKQ